MDLMKNLEKQAKDILKDEKKKEKAGDVVEGLLKEAKKKVKDKKSQKTIDTIISTVDKATSSKKKSNKKNIAFFILMRSILVKMFLGQFSCIINHYYYLH